MTECDRAKHVVCFFSLSFSSISLSMLSFSLIFSPIVVNCMLQVEEAQRVRVRAGEDEKKERKYFKFDDGTNRWRYKENTFTLS